MAVIILFFYFFFIFACSCTAMRNHALLKKININYYFWIYLMISFKVEENFTTLCFSSNQFQEKCMNVTLMVCDIICQNMNVFFQDATQLKSR